MPKDFSENVYFRKDTIENTTGEGVMDLRNIFKVGDIVQFDAVIGPDDARCKWRYVKKYSFFTPLTDTRQTKNIRYITMWRFDAISLCSSFLTTGRNKRHTVVYRSTHRRLTFAQSMFFS